MPASSRSSRSNVELVHQVVRESKTPLPLEEIQRRVEAFGPILTQNPRQTVAAAVRGSALIVPVGDGLFGWKPRVIDGSVLRLPLSSAALKGPVFEITDEVRDALWPAFFGAAKYQEREPARVILPHDQQTLFPLEFLGQGQWGSPATEEFWDWLKPQRAKPKDALLITVLDGEARTYRVKLERRGERDEAAIAARNEQIVAAALHYVEDLNGNAVPWEISAHLLAMGFYRHPVPPDTLEEIWTEDIWMPALKKRKPSARRGWVRVTGQNTEQNEDPLIASLHEDLAHVMPGHKPRGLARAAHALLAAAPGHIYQLKIVLMDSEPPIWRRVQVPGGVNLMQLHCVLQIAMGWTNSHMHQFQAGETRYCTPLPGEPNELDAADERTATLAQIAPERGSGFLYTYDFGDSWEHQVVVEEILQREPGMVYPCIVDGERACPPDDVGGVWGYAEFLEAIRDRKHPRYKELREWIGGSFDPVTFDRAQVDRLLHLL